MENQGSSAARAHLLVQAREAPENSGVYLMKEESGAVLYVGKAKNLRNRVSSYFQALPHERAWTEILVNRIHRFEVILTDTEAEALILEATLIKKFKPKFNIRLKDDKSYPYIKIQIETDYPRLEWTRRVQRDNALYFGPFPSAWAARQVMRLLNETFRLRDCSDNTFRHRSRPCILYQMEKCTAPCVGKISHEDYHADIKRVVTVLQGQAEELTKGLHEKMETAAEVEDYEEAAELRDQIKNIEIVTQTQGVIDATTQKNRDVFGIARKDSETHGTVMRIRGGRLIGVKHFHFQNSDASMTDAEILRDFISQYYGAGTSETLGQDEENELVREILTPIAPADQETLEKAYQFQVYNPLDEVTEKTEMQLVRVARTNAEYALEQSLKKPQGHGIQALEQVQEKLHLTRLPTRIECYDNSNLQGEDAVASRVVFIDGAPDKNLYRRYKIRTVEGANDFATMREVLGRRFSNSEEVLPDLVVVDGGKGQLSQAVAIMEELGIRDVPVVGLAKARTERDFRSKEVHSSFERIFIPGRKNPVALYPTSPAFKLLTHVRDEAHRFAINYHRKLRDKIG